MCKFKSIIYYDGKIFQFEGEDSHASIAEKTMKDFYPRLSASEIEDNSFKMEIDLDPDDPTITHDGNPVHVPDDDTLKALQFEAAEAARSYIAHNLNSIIQEGFKYNNLEVPRIHDKSKNRYGYKNIDKFHDFQKKLTDKMNTERDKYYKLCKIKDKHEAQLLKKVKAGKMSLNKAIKIIEEEEAKNRKPYEDANDKLNRIDRAIFYLKKPFKIKDPKYMQRLYNLTPDKFKVEGGI